MTFPIPSAHGNGTGVAADIGIAILYEDRTSGLHARRFTDMLGAALGDANNCNRAFWRCELIDPPEIVREIDADAAASEFLVVSPRMATPTKRMGGAKTILVVDEYPELCNVAALLLRRCGYRVLTAIGAQEAKEAASGNEIDLVLTDVDLHGVSSDELASWFHQFRPQTEMLFMSDHPLQQLGLHARHLITKPFIHLDLLVKEIREVFNHGRAEAPAAAAA